MYIYLVRHGEAVPEEKDPARPLSAKGRAEVEATAKGLRDEGAMIDEIWHSSKLRAKQTAEIIASVLNVTNVIEKEGLAPDDPVTPIAELLKERAARQASGEAGIVEGNANRVTQDAEGFALHSRQTHNASILIAGHLPFIPKLASLLRAERGGNEGMGMKPGGVIKISL